MTDCKECAYFFIPESKEQVPDFGFGICMHKGGCIYDTDRKDDTEVRE